MNLGAENELKQESSVEVGDRVYNPAVARMVGLIVEIDDEGVHVALDEPDNIGSGLITVPPECFDARTWLVA